MRTTQILLIAVLAIAAVAPATAATGAASPATLDSGDASVLTTDAATMHPTKCSFPITRTDATGAEVTVSEEPQRIVTLSPSAAQTMWEIGGKEKVVGVTKYAFYLEGADSRANVSGSGQTYINTEKVISLDPDLVLAPNVISNDTVNKLREAGLTVYKFHFASSLQSVIEKTRLTGKLTGECEGAAQTTTTMKDRLSTVRQAVEGEDRPRVLYVFFGYTAGKDTFIHEIITTAGGTNVAAEAGITGYQKVSEEMVVNQNPQWIVLNDDAPTVPKSDAYNSTTAVKQNQTVVVNSNYISQPAPRVVNVVVKLAQTFHPEAYAEANMTATPTPGETATSTPEPTATPAPTTSQTGPGFGITVAIVALLGALLFIRN